MTDAVLTMDEVAKSFRRKTVLDGCSFAVERGSVTALVGSNGAGKSTLLSLAVGLLTPDSGTIRVLGEGVTQRGISPGLSYLAQHKPLYPHFTVAELLRSAETRTRTGTMRTRRKSSTPPESPPPLGSSPSPPATARGLPSHWHSGVDPKYCCSTSRLPISIRSLAGRWHAP